ncbi:MAG: glycosyltransferase family 4 protein [Salinivirgaceae bacterium]
MKILMVLERDFPPDLRVENEIKSLINAGHSVSLACYGLKSGTSTFNWNGCVVFKKKVRKFIYKSSVGALKFPFYFNFWKSHLEAIINEIEPDAIHIHDLPLAKLGVYFKMKYHLKFTLDLHENWPSYLEVSSHTNSFLGKILSNIKQWEEYELEQCKNADSIIVVVDEAKERLVKLGVFNKKIFIVSNYPELSDFENIHTDCQKSENIVLFYAGGITEHRGLQFFINAIPYLLDKNRKIELRIFGEGNYTSTLKGLVQQLNIGNYVKFFGQVPYKTVLEQLIQADIALIPHTKNNHTDSTIPHKLFQYILAGKPVLVSNCSPIERIVNDISAGAVYRWNNPVEAAQKAEWIIENRMNFNEERLKQTIKDKYSWENEALKLQFIYED